MIDNSEFGKEFEPITSQQMYEIENNGEKTCGMKKLLMMENAGSRISDYLINKFNDEIINKKIVTLCGLGNNGGDAIVSNRHLSGHIFAKQSRKSSNSSTNKIKTNLFLILLGNPRLLKTDEAKTNWEIIEKLESINKIIYDENNITAIENEIEKADIIIDGIFGTGISSMIKNPFSTIIDKINNQKTKSFILSVDIPSGLNPNTGEIYDKSVKPHATITFHRIKHGLLKNPKDIGEIHPVKIGIPIEAEKDVI
ncbi:MAG TPA: NAD(P)H-hydrate epimerase [Verrucomicrobiae bacterium]|nr:NAD(P)H-hydrate epimerase [Verrucomicrobiae bacterium]